MAPEPASLVVGDPPIPVLLRRSPRARRLTLRIAAGTGIARVTAPPHVSLGDIRRFVEGQHDWLRRRQAALPDPIDVRPGAALPLRGTPLDLRAAPVRRLSRDGDALLIPEGHRQPAALIRGWLTAQARVDLAAACDRYAAAIGRTPGRITLRDPRSRWGSCSSKGALMFSWRLILTPPEVLDYVALHEMAHLREMNHSPDFWALVEAVMPGYRRHRAWLKTRGADLHRYRF